MGGGVFRPIYRSGRADTFPYDMTKKNCACTTISYRVCEVCDLREAATAVQVCQPELRVPQPEASSSIFTIVAALRALATLS